MTHIAGRASILVAFAILAAPATIVGPARAAGYGAEGEPSFGISAWFQEPPRLNGSVTLLVRIWGEDTYDVPITSTAHVSIPDGLEVLSGDTVTVAHVALFPRRKKPERVVQLSIRPVRPGPYLIRGTLSIEAGEDRGTDQTDFVLPVTLDSDRPSEVNAPHPTRFENVRQGQRYRYSGRYLVPIDSTQALLEEEITSKPKPVQEVAAACHACPGPLPTMVPFVVMVGSDGKIRESRFLDIQEEGATDPALVAAATKALAAWTFEPARAGETPVADYVVVRVPVKDGAP